MPEQKIWGTDECIFKGNCVEVHLLKLRPHEGKPTCCSWHRHAYKHNSFRVLSGKMAIMWGETQTASPRRGAVLEAGNSWAIDPGCWHRFEVTEPATVIEVVWGTSLAEDIERADVGHILENEPSGT